MATARAFPYLRYSPDEVGDPGAQLAPPYDVIDSSERDALAESSPYQSVLLELPDGGDAQNARRLLDEWIASDILEGGEVGVALIQQRYVGPDGVRRTRLGVACEVEVRDFSDGVVLPHEQTFEAPRRVRQELMDVTGANISPVFLTYHDESRSLFDLFAGITDDAPDFTSTGADGNQTAVWFVTDVSVCDEFTRVVAEHNLVIADGHHRYTAAIHHREESRAKGATLAVVGGSDHFGPPVTSTSGADGVLAVVVNSADPGVMIFPTHRVVRGVKRETFHEFVLGSGVFEVKEFDNPLDALEALGSTNAPGFVVPSGDGSTAELYTVTDPNDISLAAQELHDSTHALDVTALHSLVLDGGALLATQPGAKVSYTRSDSEALEASSNSDTLVFMLRAPTAAQVQVIAEAGGLMPQKSTYYYPKVPTGVVFRLIEQR